jgi:caffeoyl-CoA O-methyltransferase
MEKTFTGATPSIQKYVESTFHPEDEVLREIRDRAAKEGLPSIHVGAMDGLHLEVLTRAMAAKKIVEIGTLAGYSGTCMARGLPADGRLYTFEFDPHHAKVAEETFRRAGVADKVKILVGPAIENLGKIEKDGPFDLVFIDADKGSYPAYFEWAVKNLKTGGAILADNTFAGGSITDASDPTERVKALRAYNQTAAQNPKLRTTILPTSDGLTFSVKL